MEYNNNYRQKKEQYFKANTTIIFFSSETFKAYNYMWEKPKQDLGLKCSAWEVFGYK